MKLVCFGLVLVSLLSACSSAPPVVVEEAAPAPQEADPFVKDMELICHIHEQPDVMAADPARRQLLMARYLSENIQSPRTEDLMQRVAQAPPHERDAMMRQAAVEAGLGSCPFVDTLSASSPQGEAEQGGGPGGVSGPGPAPAGELTTQERELVATGGLEKSQIRDVIRQSRNKLRYCYEAKLRQDKGLRGSVVVAFVIDAQGVVSQSSVVRGTLQDEQVRACVAEVFSKMEFPDPTGGGVVKVTYPVHFSDGP